MANSQIAVTEGSGKNIASYSVSETTTKEVQRTSLNNSSGVETGVAALPLQVSIANTGANGTAVAVSMSTNTPLGTIAHDSVDSGAPIKIGFKAEATPSTITLVADADRTDGYADRDGMQLVKPFTSYADIVSGNATNTDGTSTSVIASQGGSIKTYLTTIILTNTSATPTYCEIKDGSTTKLTIPVPANGGAIVNLPVPLGGTAATAWNFDMGAATTTAYCSMVGFKSLV